MKKLLVTGALGLVGSETMRHFSEKEWEVVGIDNNARSHFFGTEKKELGSVIPMDFRNQVDVEDLFQAMQFDAIIHAGAQPSHDYATQNVLEDFSVNALGTLNLLEATRQTQSGATFIYVSTDKVYGENMQTSLVEEAYRLKPKQSDHFSPGKFLDGFDESLGLDFAGDRSFFGCSKAAGDMYAQQYAVRGMKVGIFRPGCITGRNHAGAEQHGFLAYLAKCIKEGKIYKIYGSGKQVRDQIHAKDIVSAFFEFVREPKSGAVYNIGGGPERSVSVLEAITLLEKETGKKAQIEYAEERLGDRRWDVHDVSKFRKDYPEWDYEYTLQDIINELAQ